MRNLWNRLRCLLFGHRYVWVHVFNKGIRYGDCSRCGRKAGLKLYPEDLE